MATLSTQTQNAQSTSLIWYLAAPVPDMADRARVLPSHIPDLVAVRLPGNVVHMAIGMVEAGNYRHPSSVANAMVAPGTGTRRTRT